MPTIANTLTITGTPLVTSAAASMVIQQTGDTFGTTKMSLLNRTGINGPLFENLGLDLVDFGMKPSTGLQCVIRNAHSASFQMDATNNPAGELQFQFDSLTGGGKNPWVFGEAITAMAGRLQFGTLNPGSFPANRDVGLARNAAGVLEVNSGTAGTFKDLKCDRINAVTGYLVNGVASTNAFTNADAVVGGQSFAATNAIVSGSTITVPAGFWKVGGMYHCVFDMLKTAAGTVGIVITIHMGTLGTTGDASIMTFPFTAGTAIAQQGYFDIYVVFRSVGSGTSAVIVAGGRCTALSPTTGLVGIPAASPIASSGFNSTTQTKLSIGFNGGTSFSGSRSFTQARYDQM